MSSFSFPHSMFEMPRVSGRSPIRAISFSPYNNTISPAIRPSLFHHRPTTISIWDQYCEAATELENEISRCLQICGNNTSLLEQELKRKIMRHLKDIGLLRHAHIYFECNQDDHQFVEFTVGDSVVILHLKYFDGVLR